MSEPWDWGSDEVLARSDRLTSSPRTLTRYRALWMRSVHLQTWPPICPLLLMPRLLGEPVHGVLRVFQHGGLATAVQDLGGVVLREVLRAMCAQGSDPN